jgi:hypothetical protein
MVERGASDGEVTDFGVILTRSTWPGPSRVWLAGVWDAEDERFGEVGEPD